MQEIWGVITNIFSYIIIAICTIFLNFLRKKITLFSRIGRSVFSFITGRKYILFWMDDDIKNSNLIIQCLKNFNLNKYYFRNLILARQFSYYPNNPKFVEGIILINSDVSKLSYDTNTREKIQKHILSFVEKGGILIGTHDIIYRRVRNEIFESAFGCSIDNFQRYEQPILYKINNKIKDHPLLQGLPATFYIHDSEVCWGTWSPDSLVLATFSLPDQKIALITTRNYEKGAIVWLNSGDKQAEQCKGISEPDKNLLLILRNAILNKKKIIQFNKKHITSLSYSNNA